MKCDMIVISPVHIGSGEKYTASEYVKSKAKTKKGELRNIVKRIDVSKYYISLDDNKKDDFLVDLSSNKDFNLGDFDKKISNEYRKYMCIDKSKKQLNPANEITECIKTLNQAYIPGSSIKGAIKSAILYRHIGEREIDYIKSNLFNNRGRINNFKYNQFLNNIFSSRKAHTPAQGDIMKFLQVSDTTTVKNPTIYDILTVMASFSFGHNEFYSRNKRTREPTLSYLETIDRAKKLSFNINNNYDEKMFKKLDLNDKKHLIDLDYVKKSIFIFSKALINHELKFAEDYDMNYLVKFYNELDKRNTQEKPVLRVGGGSGFLSTTIALKVKDEDYELYKTIRKSLRNNYDYAFPKSRKITQTGGRPLGWVQLNFNGE